MTKERAVKYVFKFFYNVKGLESYILPKYFLEAREVLGKYATTLIYQEVNRND